MASNRVKCLLAENKRLQSLVGKLAGTIQTIHLQIEQKEDTLAKRRIASSTKTSTIMRTLPTTSASLTNEAVCSPCQVATDVFGELKEAVDAFAEKLNAALADKEAQLSSALKEIDDEIGKPLWLREIVETKREVDGSKENEKKI